MVITVNYPYRIPCGQRHSILSYTLLWFQSLCFFTLLWVHLSVPHPPGSPLYVVPWVLRPKCTLTLTWKTSHFLFCSDSQDIFLLKHEENHPLKQDFESAAVIVFIILFPSECGIVGGDRGGDGADGKEERVTDDILGHFLLLYHDCKCLSLSHSHKHQSMRHETSRHKKHNM